MRAKKFGKSYKNIEWHCVVDLEEKGLYDTERYYRKK
jgi:hypothetical protein